MNPKLRGYVLCHATFAQFKGMQCRGAARLSYLFFSNEKCGIEDIWSGGVGGMAYFVRRFCSLPRLAFLCPFRSAGFTRGGESRPGQGFGNEVFSGRRNGRAAIAHGWPVEKRAAMRY